MKLLADPQVRGAVEAATAKLRERVRPTLKKLARHMAKNPERVGWSRVPRRRAIQTVAQLGGDPRRAAAAWDSQHRELAGDAGPQRAGM